MITKCEFKIQERYQEIGWGDMIYSPRRVDGWWVTPAQDYHGQVPVEIRKNLIDFLNLGIPVQGFLVAEDLKEIEAKKQEAAIQAVKTGLGIVLAPLIGIGLGLVYLLSAAMSYDPMLIAVLEDGRWICLGTWYD